MKLLFRTLLISVCTLILFVAISPLVPVHADGVLPVAGWNSQPSQVSALDTTVRIDVYVNDSASNPATYTVEYSLNGGITWANANHLSGGSFPISGNSITDITTYGDGPSNRSNVAFLWNYTEDASAASTTNAEIRVTPHDIQGDGDPIVSDPFTLKPPPAPPVFAEDSGSVSDITGSSVIVHYDLSSIGSAQLHHFELHYADDAYYTGHSDYTQYSSITFTGSFATEGATDVTGLSCGTTYHFAQTFTNEDGETATSSDATFVTSDCTGDEGVPFASGDGTSEDPWIIDDCSEIPTVNNYLNDWFRLVTDIDCTEMGNRVMIGGFLSAPFTGTFDGGEHTITFSIVAPTERGLGLFRMVYGGTIKNLTVNGSVVGEDVNGAIAGLAADSTFENVHASSTVLSIVANTPEYPFIGTGGIVGGMYGGSIDKVTFTGFVGAPVAAGGIVGFAFNDLTDGPGAIISRSSADLQMYGGSGAGGIAGYLGAGSQIRNSYASSSVAFYPDFTTHYGAGALGGLVGFMDIGTVSRSYSTGIVSAGGDTSAAPSGGLIGVIQNAGAIVVHSFSASVVTTEGAPVGGFVGVLADGDGTEQFYDDYFDTARSGQASCSIDSDFEQCIGIDGSETGYWINVLHSPLGAWDTADTWDTSGAESEFPLLRYSLLESPDESDAFTGGPSPEEEISSDTENVPTPQYQGSHHGSTSSFASGSFASETTAQQAELAELMKQYQQLLKMQTSVGVSPAIGVSLTRNLKVGVSGSDVKALQQFLVTQGYVIRAGATGYFGAQTRVALVAYQKAHGITHSTGYLGPLTRAYIASH